MPAAIQVLLAVHSFPRKPQAEFPSGCCHTAPAGPYGAKSGPAIRTSRPRAA